MLLPMINYQTDQNYALNVKPYETVPQGYYWEKQSCVIKKHGTWYCNRCGSRLSQDWSLPDGRRYCRICLPLGRMTQGEAMYYLRGPNNWPLSAEVVLTNYPLKLTVYQDRLVQQLIKQLAQPYHHHLLIQAVTGAGKTEMSCGLIAWLLARQQRIAVVSPRVDVCLELYPRYCKYFPGYPSLLMTGQQPFHYHWTPLVVATVHQLWHFHHAFDVIILDESDAFPYRHDRALHYAVQQALKPTGLLVELTATPTLSQRLASCLGGISTFKLSRRFHGYPLPVPTVIQAAGGLGTLQLIKQLHDLSMVSYRDHRQLLIFVPYIKWVQPLTQHLQKLLTEKFTVAGTSAQDEERMAKVRLFRKQQLDCLITTTILERGVTFTNIDVIVLGADDSNFNLASLVQIAGRAGRSAKFPDGRVYFIYQEKNLKLSLATHYILQVNRRA